MSTNQNKTTPPTQLPRRRRVAFMLLPVVLALAGAEAAVRGLGLGGDSRAARIVHSVIQNSGLVIKDAELFWRLQPKLELAEHEWVAGPLRTNSLGLRGGEVAVPKPPGVRRVVCLGDSATFGWQVHENEAYPAQLGAALGDGWDVVNAGVPGYTSLQGLRWAKRELAGLEPDVVALMFGWNDLKLATGGVPDAARELLTPGQLRTERVLLNWQTLTWLRALRTPDAQRVAPAGGGEQVSRATPDELATNLARLIDLADAQAARVILINMPIAPLEGVEAVGVTPTALTIQHKRYMDVVRALAERWHLPLVDADALISGRAKYFDHTPADFIHFNPAAHALLAQTLSEVTSAPASSYAIDAGDV